MAQSNRWCFIPATQLWSQRFNVSLARTFSSQTCIYQKKNPNASNFEVRGPCSAARRTVAPQAWGREKRPTQQMSPRPAALGTATAALPQHQPPSRLVSADAVTLILPISAPGPAVHICGALQINHGTEGGALIGVVSSSFHPPLLHLWCNSLTCSSGRSMSARIRALIRIRILVRPPGVYLRYIVDNYHRLPETVVFVQEDASPEYIERALCLRRGFGWAPITAGVKGLAWVHNRAVDYWAGAGQEPQIRRCWWRAAEAAGLRFSTSNANVAMYCCARAGGGARPSRSLGSAPQHNPHLNTISLAARRR